MGNLAMTPITPGADPTAAARESVRALRDALERAEHRHQECWDEAERVGGLRELLYRLKREDRARKIAAAEAPFTANQPHTASCSRFRTGETGCDTAGVSNEAGVCCCENVICPALQRRIAHLESTATHMALQSAFLDLYSAELLVDTARAELYSLLRSLPKAILSEIGERLPGQAECDELPNAWAIAAVGRHVLGKRTPGEPDPVDQLNYRRWLVELSQGALDYSGHLEREIAWHENGLRDLERQAANVDFFDAGEQVQIECAITLQRARITACREQIEELAATANALGKRMDACEEELHRFLTRIE